MHQMEEENGLASPDLEIVFQRRQSVILNQIDVLTRDSAINRSSDNEHIYTLKQEYSQLVKKRTKLARSPLSDPVEVLPLDLWPDIIRNIVDEHHYSVDKLLTLISVSKGWSSLLSSLPVIWACIRLDQWEPDYLAKAMMCIQLSRECEIDLNIRHLTAEEWRGISSIIVPEGRRIRRLSFINGTDFMVIWQVLGDFTTFPVLQELFLTNGPMQLSDEQYIHTLSTEKMPSIKVVTTTAPGNSQIWNPHLTHYCLETESLTKDAIEALVRRPHLRNLTFREITQTPENTASQLKSSSGLLTSFIYSGPSLCRSLTWVGDNLSTLSTYLSDYGTVSELIEASARFPRLHTLELAILSTTPGQPTQNNSHAISHHNSIRVMRFVAEVISGTDWGVLFSIFFPVSPHLEILSVLYGLITDMAWNSIQSITNLRNLYIAYCNIEDSSLIALNMESLRKLQWTAGLHESVQLLTRLQADFLQTLWLTGIDIGHPTTTTKPYTVVGTAFPNITSLVISNGSSTTWKLWVLPRLRELELQASSPRWHMPFWVSDVLEAILMRPRDNPALDKITLACDFIEWDILLLMLERRNFLNEPGISSIKTLVVNYNLPYCLLYPLSELVGGRFVERDSNWSFSLEAIGERMWNESLPGCMKCHYSIQGCDYIVEPSHLRYKIHHHEAAGRGKEYYLAYEYLTVDLHSLWI